MGVLRLNGKAYGGDIAHHYSTNETVIGTWIDGKPLYQKTVTGLSVALNGANWVYWNSGIAIDKLISLDAYTINTNRLQHCAIAEYMYDSTNDVMLGGFSGYNRTINVITIQYTKSS